MSYLVQAVVMKCRKGDGSSERFWCVYKPKKSGSKELMSPQPEGFPKTYLTKKDAKQGVKMMKTFGSIRVKSGWYTDSLLPIVYAVYKNNTKIFNHPKVLLSKIEDRKVRGFLEIYPSEIEVLKIWAASFTKLLSNAEVLKAAYVELRESGMITEAQNLNNIYISARKNASLEILKRYYSKHKVETAQKGLFVFPNGEYEVDSEEIAKVFPINKDTNQPLPDLGERYGTGLGPGRGLGDGRMSYNRLGFLCPRCQMNLMRGMPSCIFCGDDPINNLEVNEEDENSDNSIEMLEKYLG